MTTTSVKKIDSRLEKLEPGSLRHQVMTALRQFRASWVELGRLLNDVVYGGDYKEWGYDDFEVYCARELGLKKPTVQKLMVSYNYMRKYEGQRLEAFEEEPRQAPPEIPDFQTVELLDRVRRRDEMPEEKIDELHRRAFDGESEEPEFRKELRQYLRPQISEEEMNDRSASRKRELVAILRSARDLRRRLATTNAVPGGLKERLEQCLVELEGLEE
ncbi:MAG: hypothetical protein LUE17_11960 [Planctomycetaceae bacterium]|nr:hypothetical protein [Planctomycetaceae bacterium]